MLVTGAISIMQKKTKCMAFCCNYDKIVTSLDSLKLNKNEFPFLNELKYLGVAQ